MNRPKVLQNAFVKLGYMLETPCIRRYPDRIVGENASGGARQNFSWEKFRWVNGQSAGNPAILWGILNDYTPSSNKKLEKI